MPNDKLPDTKIATVVIPGYDVLTATDRAKVDKIVREHVRARQKKQNGGASR